MLLNESTVCPWSNRPGVLGRACLVLGQWRAAYANPRAPVEISASRGTWPGVTSSVLHRNACCAVLHGPPSAASLQKARLSLQCLLAEQAVRALLNIFCQTVCFLLTSFHIFVHSWWLKRLLMALFSAGCEMRADNCNQPYLLCIKLIHSGICFLSSWPFT